MAAARQKIRGEDVHGLKYFKALRGLIERLHVVGTERDKAGNRELHMDQYCTLILLWFFSPIVDSLRGLQQAGELDKVRKHFGVGRASLGSLSEGVAVFDPEPLKEIAQELFDQLPDVSAGRFDIVGQTLTAVDGSIVETLARVARLSWLPKSKGKTLCGYRLHTQFEVLRGVPSRIDVTPASPKGDADERAVLAHTVEPDRMYIMDRGYAQFALWNVIVAKNSSYCCRIRDNSAHDVVQTLELTDSDIAAGVVSDEVVSFDAGSKARIIPDHPVRIVTVKATPHRSGGKTGGGRTGPNCDGFLRIATNRLDLPAELVSELYRLRWLIENFFRMFKQLLGCRHLLSTKTNGVEIQVYCGIIACLLIMLYTGRQPAKRTFEMVCFFLSGWASPEELERHIESLPQPA
jgi:IS4 transposase